MLISIIIVNYNVKYFVEQCINSVYQSKNIDCDDIEIFVVDNLSKDNSVSYLKSIFPRKTFPHIHIIANKSNVGFGKANNQVLERAKGKYILFLNPDTLLTEYTLADAVSQAESTQKLGALGIKMLHTNGTFALESKRGIPSPWVSFCKMSGLTALFPKSKIFGKYYMQYCSKNEVNEIEILSGAFMLIPRKALNETGGFDETFFMYGEDIDLSYRLIQKGFHNYYCPTPFLHYKGESTKKNTYRYVHVFYEAMLIFFKKHYKHYNLLISLPIKIAIILRAILALVIQQTTYLRAFLFPHSNIDNQKMLYIGHSADMVRQLAEEYGINIDYYNADENSLPEGHLDSRINTTPYLHIVYDLNDFSISKILHFFEYQKNRSKHIGTFNSNRGILITGSKTFVKG